MARKLHPLRFNSSLVPMMPASARGVHPDDHEQPNSCIYHAPWRCERATRAYEKTVRAANSDNTSSYNLYSNGYANQIYVFVEATFFGRAPRDRMVNICINPSAVKPVTVTTEIYGVHILVPPFSSEVRLVSRAGVPANVRSWLGDRCCLG
jgi:hypothetical protein